MDSNTLFSALFWSAIAFLVPITYVAIMCRIANPFSFKKNRQWLAKS
ncbi:hypothetical protein H6G17_32195 [Chroococcidiopsis sp. FACHB-1243]|nr:hypothetical protein [Chroococcidiopsis sp. [FACHB-1243]]MBD2310053.1 hypothetical protein [Chroococcidiopsis sp. [FACHB-1243]]